MQRVHPDIHYIVRPTLATEHLVLVMGTIDPERPVRVRAHREYLPGDVFGYAPRNTRSLLQAANYLAYGRLQPRDSTTPSRLEAVLRGPRAPLEPALPTGPQATSRWS